MSESYYKTPFSCSYSAGRWNPKGTGMIYAGSGPAVSLLEYLCIKGSAVSGKPWYMVEFEILSTDLIGTLGKDSLPEDWNTLPHAKVTQDFGKIWLQEMEFPFLKVPSARIHISFYPLEHNLLINPEFPDLKKHIEFVGQVRFDYLLSSI